MWYFFGAKKINISEVKRGAYELPQVLNAYVLPQSMLRIMSTLDHLDCVDYGYSGLWIQWIMGTLDHVDCVDYGYSGLWVLWTMWIVWIMDTVDYGYSELWIQWIVAVYYQI